MFKAGVIVGTLSALASAKIYFKEDFNDDGWKDRWVQPTQWKEESQLGKWEWTTGVFKGDPENKGIQTSQDARFYGLSAKMAEPFTNKDKDLVVQMAVRHDQDLDCGGAYIKLMGDIDQDTFGGDTPYQVMFGPDVCGPSNRKTHVIFNYPPKNENLLVKNQVETKWDKARHLFTLVVRPNNTFEVFIDKKSVREGELEKEFDFLLPKEIKDPDAKKPSDWVDKKKIPDPEDVKPEGYDDIPAEIPDPEAEKPEDWDDEEDGEWEPPMIDNPEYKGEWKPKMIPNPEYQGPWVHPMIPNPDYMEDGELHVRCKDCLTLGFELWQVKSGTLFDDILVSDSLEEAFAYAEETFDKVKEAEDADRKEKEAAEALKRKEEAEAAAAEEEEEEEEGEEEEEEEDMHEEL